MNFFFEPKGIAVVGATPEPYTGGRFLVSNLTLGYNGPIYPVNPKYNEVLGLKCYPRVSDIEGPLDLALIFVRPKLCLKSWKTASQRVYAGQLWNRAVSPKLGQKERPYRISASTSLGKGDYEYGDRTVWGLLTHRGSLKTGGYPSSR